MPIPSGGPTTSCSHISLILAASYILINSLENNTTCLVLGLCSAWLGVNGF
ncbi:hypothetical protein [Pseudomonas sp. FP2338]|uniref:hypothetical protein n=1 Tax=Pseudomonas sp. FP2338 TaxID=2954093 RepID=UPI0027372965|nr:hypothetical protein [Pseudomonas sp. FP2338]WLH84466.1 hypothetical protein PSH96_27340 [Pseudomonas sp. FP2338]